MAAERQTRITVEHLTVTAGSSAVEVLVDVSLSVGAGEVLGVVGESGSGKTTLGLAMLRHARRGLRIASGAIVVDGQDLLGLDERHVAALRGKAIAYVPQDPGTALNPARRVGPQLREALTAHGSSREQADARIAELLAEVGLQDVEHVLHAYPHQLSGGQQQRVTIAMAFACRPGLIVMDEPTTGLDVTTQHTVLQTVKELCGRYGVAAVYVSHDVLVVGTVADRVAVVYAGRVVELGPTAAVFRSPRHPYTRGLLRAVPSPDRASRLVGIDGFQPRPGERPAGCSFAPRCPIAIERCRTELPELLAVGAGAQLARCFLADAPPAAAPAAVFVDTGAAPTTEPLLTVRGLSASYGARPVLFDVDLDVPASTCVGVVGESGSGKTTLARCLAGLHERFTGDVRYGDAALMPGVAGRTRAALREIQYIFQNPYASLNPRRTIGATVALPLEHFTDASRRERDQRVAAALDAVALPVAMLNRYPDQLSGGERQRAAIARALIVEPRVLICDEITSALDVSVQAAVIELLVRLQREQRLSLVFITHNLAVVRAIAQHVAVMQLGRVVESGPAERLLDDPQDDYTRRLLADVPKLADVGVDAIGGGA